MHIRSLGYRTDLIFPAFDGAIIDRGTYLVVQTPANPTFYWGNFLLFAHPPQPDDQQRWRQLFAVEIGTPPEVMHQTFGWDTTAGELGTIQPFLDAGFRLNHQTVLTSQRVQPPPKYAMDVTVRPLSTDTEWDQALANQIRSAAPASDDASQRIFMQRQMARYRAMAQAGLGAWFGAFLDQQLVGDLGIFRDQAVGRFQWVVTHPDYRRRGIAGTLVYQAAQYALTQLGVGTLVIVADYDSPASRIYESVGFQPTEQQVGLEWSEQAERSGNTNN